MTKYSSIIINNKRVIIVVFYMKYIIFDLLLYLSNTKIRKSQILTLFNK